ncbi:MAG TPA: alpha/beta hydrolase [Chthonomonadaceae bacterium]|nr:alpha/beta hydrolase [Chthonomonadaceae bacterium]
MRRKRFWMLLGWLIMAALGVGAQTAPQPDYTRQEDVIYGRKYGTALTMDVFTPKQHAKGVGVIFVVSGGWFSAHEAINPAFLQELLKRGYTVFAVVHGSQPKYTIPEILGDMHRAVRFIRYHAKEYGIDPDRIGITGASAGGHLSLMQGMAGNKGNPNANDPVERMSSRIQAVACFFPPTDFLNYGQPGQDAIGRGILKDFHAAFDFHEFDMGTKSFVPITDENRIKELARAISPLYHVTAEAPPTLIIHGDADTLVPIQQAQVIIAKLKEVNVPAELVVKHGAGHGWPHLDQDMTVIADWFDKYLKPAPNQAARP